MRRITKLKLTEEQEAELELIIKQDTRYRVRNRANAIIYKSKSYKVEEISEMLGVRPQTVYLWIREYEKEGIESLYEKQGKGRKSILKLEYTEEIKALVINQPSLSIANARIREKLNIYMHNVTLSRFLKKNKIQLYTSSEETSQEA
jgi:transposase